MFQSKHFLCSSRDISCGPIKTSLVFQSGHLSWSKHNMFGVPIKTFPVSNQEKNRKKSRRTKFLPSKNETSGIVRNAFSQSLRPIGAILGGLTAVRSFEKNFDVEKLNVGNRLKRVFPKFGSCASHVREVNDHSKFGVRGP